MQSHVLCSRTHDIALELDFYPVFKQLMWRLTNYWLPIVSIIVFYRIFLLKVLGRRCGTKGSSSDSHDFCHGWKFEFRAEQTKMQKSSSLRCVSAPLPSVLNAGSSSSSSSFFLIFFSSPHPFFVSSSLLWVWERLYQLPVILLMFVKEASWLSR